MTMPWDHEISNKWPAARLSGPDVGIEQAMEYILRTDCAIESPIYICNDRRFCEEFTRLLGYDDSNWEYHNHFLAELGHVRLNHLSSNWIASPYIGGPHGPVSPFGLVRLAKNFGKWPSLEVIETDLTKVAKVFPWLSFDLWLWDSPDEGGAVRWGSDPTHAWALADGDWRRVPTEGACNGKAVPAEYDMTQVLSSIAVGSRRETTWTIDQIKHMWGDRFRQAAEAYTKKSGENERSQSALSEGEAKQDADAQDQK